MQGFGRDGNTIDIASIQDWLSSTSNIVVENSLLSTKSCIFLTPKLLFRNNEKAYVPTAFSIGPLHHGKPDFEEAEKIKLKYTGDLISTVQKRKKTIVQDLVKVIAGLEKEARECYSVPVEFSRDEFIKILLVDGCFLIELFHKERVEVRNHPAFNRPFLHEVISTDVFLLENQIPWMVLDGLYKQMTAPYVTEPLTRPALEYISDLEIGQFHSENSTGLMRLLDCISHLEIGQSPRAGLRLSDYLSHLEIGQSHRENPTSFGPNHLLDLLRSSLIGSTKTEGLEYGGKWELIPSASSLKEAGVKFEKFTDSGGMLDIKFSNGILKIPPFTIHEATESLFRNMISLEQCYIGGKPRISSYAMLLDILINTPKDLDILCKKEIVRNWLNPEEATQMFNRLYYDACFVDFYYHELCKDVNAYCRRRWPRWRAIYFRNNFSSPWAIASQVFAAIVFVLALLQTIFSII